MRQHMTVRQFRANLAHITAKGDAVTIGDHYTIRALYIPVPVYESWKAAEREKAFRTAARAARNLCAELRKAQ